MKSIYLCETSPSSSHSCLHWHNCIISSYFYMLDIFISCGCKTFTGFYIWWLKEISNGGSWSCQQFCISDLQVAVILAFIPRGLAIMFPGIHSCFQLLRIGSSSAVSSPGTVSDSVHDLYTFRPALANSVFRLGRRAELCDVTLESSTISRIHAELHAEKQSDAAGEESWKVQVRDRSSHGGCYWHYWHLKCWNEFYCVLK